MPIMTEVARERRRISDQVAKLDAERSKLRERLDELEVAEQVLARFGKLQGARPIQRRSAEALPGRGSSDEHSTRTLGVRRRAARLERQPMPLGEAVAKALWSEGIVDLRSTGIIPSRTDVKGAAARGMARDRALEQALKDAKTRGRALKDELRADPEMLTTADIAKKLGMSEEGVRLKRKRHEVLGLEFAKRGIRYPSWQVLENRRLLPALPRLFAILGDSPWAIYRFLLQRHPELGGARAVDALMHGRIERVLAAAENVAAGAFS